MANPRNVIDFEGIDAGTATFLADGTDIVYSSSSVGGAAAVGLAAMMSAAKTVRLTADATLVVGKVILVEADGKVTVQHKGFVGLPAGTSAVLTAGLKVCGAVLSAARGYVRGIVNATLGDVAVARGFIVDGGDTANVYIALY